MQIKYQLGKLKLRLPLPDLIQEQQQTNHIQLLPIESPVGVASPWRIDSSGATEDVDRAVSS